MLKSMTAFGRARRMSSDGALDITAELRSVNSRYLDVTVRMSRQVAHLEDKVKAYLAEAGITRGKVEVYVGVDVLETRGLEVLVDHEAARSYIAALEDLRDTFGLKDDISVMRVAANRDLFTTKKPEEDDERDWAEIRTVLAEAVAGFSQMRAKEGENLCADLSGKLETLEGMAAKVKTLSEEDIAGYPAKLETRIRQFLADFDAEASEQRILTEAAIFADKAAIDEELVRLASHFKAFREILSSDEAAGRKLDFLVQEINRETNTIGSKAGNAQIAHLVVDMKTEIEKIREQIQNLE
ncbi:MAG: YicC family protein [Clostridia bacterium]|nr:YicC family protein [Clostridia bacterium]MBR5365161.1 YicC family protein [Clostridia bacterium]